MTKSTCQVCNTTFRGIPLNAYKEGKQVEVCPSCFRKLDAEYRKNKKQLEKAVAKMEAEIDAYTNNVKVVSEFSNRFHGLDRATEIVESLLA